MPSLSVESLEQRAMLAVTAELSGGDLLISYNAAGDLVADISSDGTNYTVSGTGLAATQLEVAAVTGKIIVDNVGGQKFEQRQFTVLAGTALANPLDVKNVETVTLTGGIAATTAGDVTISCPGLITLANDISTSATNGNIVLLSSNKITKAVTLSAGAGNIKLGRIDGAFDLVVNSTGSTEFGEVGASAPLVSLTTDAGGTVSLQSVTTTGAQTYSDDTVTLGGSYETLNSSFSVDKVTTLVGNSSVFTRSGSIAFKGTVDGGFTLAANSTGATTFGGAVGGNNALVSLTTDKDGTTAINGGSVKTSGADGQVYNDAVTLGANTVLDAAAGAIDFKGTVDGGFTLAANSSGATTFGGAVGGTNALVSLTTDKDGTTAINGGSVKTSGSDGQVYNDAVTLGANTVLDAAAGAIDFKGTVDGGFTLSANSSGVTTFGGAVGGTNALVSLTTDKDGTVSLASVTTTGAQTYNDDTVTLNGTYKTTDSAFTVDKVTKLSGNVAVNTGAGAGNITFKDTLDGGNTLDLTAGTGNVTFTGLVGDTAALGAITVNSATNVTANGIRAASLTQVAGSGTTTLNGGAFTSAPAVTEAVRTSGAAGISLTGTNLAVNGAMTTANAGTVTLDQSGTIVIAAAGAISADGKVSVKAIGGITTAGDVTTTDDDVDFESKVTLSGNVAVNTGAGAGNITFKDTLDGAKRATLAAGTGSIFFKAAVGSKTPLAGLTLTSAASTTAESTVKLAKAADDSGQDGFTIAAGVNNVTMTASGSSVTGFARDGIAFLGGSTQSFLSGFTVSGNGSNGMNFAAGDYVGTTLTANTIRDNGDTTAHVGDGILVRGANLMIGWDATPETVNAVQNTITGNALNGIRISGNAATGNTILSNTIFLNGYVADGLVVGEGIALTDQGNDNQAAPRILDVVRDNEDGGSPVVRVQFVVDAAGSYLVQFFSNTGDNDNDTESMDDDRGLFPADVNGFEGRTFVGESPLSTIATAGVGKPVIQPVGGSQVVTGNSLQTITIPASLLAAGSWLTATATKLTGTAPLATSGFSSGVQCTAAPVLAVGADGRSSTWNREYTFSVKTNASISVTGLAAGELAALSARNARTGIPTLRGTPLVLTIDGKNVTATVTGAVAARGSLTVALNLVDGQLPSVGTRGSMVLGSASLPAAVLYDASNASLSPLIRVGSTEIEASLLSAVTSDRRIPTTVTEVQAKNFVNRFQGGLRTASNDFDGDGHVDLVTAPGGIPARPGSGIPGTAANPGVRRQTLADAFGAAARIITIYNGNPATKEAWASVSLDVSGEFPGECGGFLVTIGNVRPERAGSRNAVAELIVASTSKVRIYEILVESRGAKPSFSNPPTNAEISPSGSISITGIAAGNFTGQSSDDIVVALTTAKTGSLLGRFLRSPGAANTAKVQVYAGDSDLKAASKQFFIDSRVRNGAPARGGVSQNVFFFGAALAVGDIDNALDQKPELVLTARENGLGNFRVLGNDVVAGGIQTAVNQALSPTGRFSAAQRSANTAANPLAGGWQPKGGPDFFAGYANVPMPVGLGLSAPLSVAVVEGNGRDFKAEVFATLGAGNQTPNTVRQLGYVPNARGSLGDWTVAGEQRESTSIWRDVPGDPAELSKPVKTRFALGGGLRLG